MAPRGDGTIYQTPDGRWHANLTVAGRRVHRSAKTRPEVLSKLRALRGLEAAGRAASGRLPTVRDWIAYWLASVAPGRAQQGTLDGYASIAEHWIVPAIGDVRLDHLTVAQARDTINAPRVKGRSGSTCQAVQAVLRRALNVAMQEHPALTRNVAALVDGPTRDGQPIDPPDRRDARMLLNVADALPRNGARWVLALALGMRQGECLGLAWTDIDLDEGTLAVTYQLRRRRGAHGCGAPKVTRSKGGPRKVWPCGKAQGAQCPRRTRDAGLFLKPPKSKASKRVIALPDEVITLLRRHRTAQTAERLATHGWTGWETTPDRERRARRVDLVFAQPDGTPIDPRQDWEIWKGLLADAGVQEARLHDARHTAASVLLEMGVDVKVVSAILGHSSVRLTQDTYQHLFPDIAAGAATAMSTALWGVEPAQRRRRAL